MHTQEVKEAAAAFVHDRLMDPAEAERVVLRFYSRLLLDGVRQVQLYHRIQEEHPEFWALTPLPVLISTVRERLKAVLEMLPGKFCYDCKTEIPDNDRYHKNHDCLVERT